MDQATIEAYDRYATQYDLDTIDFWERFPVGFLARFIELSGKKVIDIGSGPGRDAVILQEHGFDVTCLDASQTMVTLTQEKGFTSILGDFNNLPFAEDSFDGAWAYTSLLHTPKTAISRPLSEIHRILQPNGLLGLGMIEGETEIYRTTEQVPMPRLFSFYTQTELEKIVRRSGFTILHQEVFKPGSRRYLNLIAQKTSD